MDIEAVKAALAEYDQRIDSMAAQAEALKVETEDQNVTAVEMAGQAKKVARAIESARKGFVGPPNEYVKAVNGLANHYKAKLAGIEACLKGKITQFQARLELERRKREEAARKAAEEAQKKIDAEAKAAGVEPVKIDAPVLPKRETVTRTEAGSAHQQKVWTFEVEDPAQVPREYLAVDEKKIREAVANGIREIPGVKIYQETRTVIRT
ncbi:MAG: hypothetical protein JRJ59_11965 [Deltaproteobacteria bacterium]|nr:hypothetical protein [Deltaproteobacteria bacterium]